MKLRKIEWDDLKLSVDKWGNDGYRVHASLHGLSFVNNTFFMKEFDARKDETRAAIVLVIRRKLLEIVKRFDDYLDESQSALPSDTVLKLLKMRDALVLGDTNEAYHLLYSIADPAFQSFVPWEKLEQKAKAP